MFSLNNRRKRREQKQNRALWREALLSGKYQQGDTALVQFSGQDLPEVRHCCLGVAAEAVLGLFPVHNNNTDPVSPGIQTTSVAGYKFPGHKDHVYTLLWPNDLFEDVFGIQVDDLDPSVPETVVPKGFEPGHPQQVFSRFNDSAGFTFQQIAERIPK